MSHSTSPIKNKQTNMQTKKEKGKKNKKRARLKKTRLPYVEKF